MKKKKFKIMFDMGMTALLPVLMAYQLVGETVHEWIGGIMFLLFLLHHSLNLQWIKNLLKGRYSPYRVLVTMVDLLLLAVMMALPFSGMIMSKHVFVFLPFNRKIPAARITHLLASYWGFVLMSFHLGLHWNMMTGKLRQKITGQRTWRFMRFGAALLVLYGIYAFYKRRLGYYMLLVETFVFFDFEEPLVFFFVDYLAIMGVFVWLGYFLSKAAKGGHGNRKGGGAGLEISK